MTFWSFRRNGFIRRIGLVLKFVTSQPGSQTIQYTYHATCHKVKATRQWNLVSKLNVTRRFFLSRNHVEIEAEGLVPDFFLFFLKKLYSRLMQVVPSLVPQHKTALQFPADLVTFTEEILYGKLHFLCSVSIYFDSAQLGI